MVVGRWTCNRVPSANGPPSQLMDLYLVALSIQVLHAL